MKDNELLKIQVILSSVVILLLSVLIVIIAVGGLEAKSEVQSFKDELSMPDFSNVKELMDKFEPLLDLVIEFNNPMIKHYFGESINFTGRLDEINGSDLMLELLLAMRTYFVNESWRRE